MAHRALDLTLVGANLEARNGNIMIGTPHCVYAAIATLSNDIWTEQSTPADELGGHNPTWNHACRFFVPADVASAAQLYIRVLIRAKRMFGNQDIDVGESIIPLRDLLIMDGIQTQPRPASYVIRADQEPGKLHGVLTISYKLHDAGEQAAAAALAPVTSPRSTHAPFASSYRPPMASPSRYNYGSYGYGYGTYYPQQNMSTLQQGRQMQNYANWDSFGMGQRMTGSDGAPWAALGRRFADHTRMDQDAYNNWWDDFGMGQGTTGSDGAPGAALGRRYADHTRMDQDAYNDWYNNFGMGLGMTGSDGAPGATLGRRFADHTRMEDAYNAGYAARSRNAWDHIRSRI